MMRDDRYYASINRLMFAEKKDEFNPVYHVYIRCDKMEWIHLQLIDGVLHGEIIYSWQQIIGSTLHSVEISLLFATNLENVARVRGVYNAELTNEFNRLFASWFY